ncbi:unnamed protein product [Brugia pahangi]|uniref:Uncharacterized protein n=1 Tax=Brugia pahangi TaxID=6280 RepID=A0A0N4TGG8_BRUPA|nr:unnamed protein product [Brugia pahangi]
MLSGTEPNDTSGIIEQRQVDAPDATLIMLSPSSSAVVVPFCSSVKSLQTNNDLIDLSDKEIREYFGDRPNLCIPTKKGQ